MNSGLDSPLSFSILVLPDDGELMIVNSVAGLCTSVVASPRMYDLAFKLARSVLQ